jgi:hypothetical protein
VDYNAKAGLCVIVGMVCALYAIFVLAGWPWALLALGLLLFWIGATA